MALYTNTHYLASLWPDFNYSLKHTSNLRHPEVVQFRISCLEFWHKHGLAAALDYAGVSRSTLYAWRKALMDSRKLDRRMGRASLKALDPKSTRPIKCKSTRWSPIVVKYIRELVTLHPELGRQKVYHFLKRYLERIHMTLLTVSESTVGRIINWLRQSGRLPSKGKLRINAQTGKLHAIKPRRRIRKQRRADLPFPVRRPGDLVQIDGVEIHSFGKFCYIVNAI